MLSFIMLYAENISLQDFSGFLQIGSHIYIIYDKVMIYRGWSNGEYGI